MPRSGSLRPPVYPLPYLNSLPPHFRNPIIFSLTPILMTSLFPVQAPTLIRWLRSLLSTHQILRSWQMSKVWQFLLQNPPSLFSLLNSHNLYNHPQVTLNNSILPLERTPCILGVTFDPHFKSNAHVKSVVARASLRTNILKALADTNWDHHTYHLYVPYPVPFHVCSSHLVPQHLTIPYSKTPRYPNRSLARGN